MHSTTTSDLTTAGSGGIVTPARWYAALAGGLLVVLGGPSLILEDVGFGTLGSLADQPNFLIWTVSGWTAIFWIAMGAAGLVAVARPGSARTYAGAAGIVFAAVAVWGFIDGNDVVSLLAADTANNLTHAALAVLGLLAAAMPPGPHRAEAAADVNGAGATPSPARDLPRARGSEHHTLG